MVDFRPLLFANALVLMLLVAAGFSSLQTGSSERPQFATTVESWVQSLRGASEAATEAAGDAAETEEPSVATVQPQSESAAPGPFEDQVPPANERVTAKVQQPEVQQPEIQPPAQRVEPVKPDVIDVELDPPPAQLADELEIRPIEPRPEAAPEPTTASLVVRSNVYNDSVTINGREYGSTRLNLELEPGKYQIVVNKDGHRRWQQTVSLQAGDEQRIFAELEAFTTVQYRDGIWRGGLKTGDGTYEDETGLTYTGEFRDGVFHGQGRAEFPDGRRYDGDWVNGQPDGRGTLRLPNGDIYSGGFANGAYSGEGTLTTDAGDIFTGSWARGSLNGRGTLTAADGMLYVGGFRNGQYHGEGTLTYPDGRHYEGGFADGLFHGKGVLILSDGKKYEGNFMEGKYHGAGDLLNPNGSRITANFRYGEPYGQVRLTTAEGEVFTARSSEPGVCYRENSYRATQCPPMPGW